MVKQITMAKSKKDYSFNLVEVVPDREETLKILEQTVKEIVKGKGKFYLGKTYVDKIEECTFDEKNKDTWRCHGIQNRHRDHSKNKGLNQLVVICLITKSHVPTCEKDSPERYTLSLESELINRFTYTEDLIYRGKIVNATAEPGKKCDDDNLHAGFVIYVATGDKESQQQRASSVAKTSSQMEVDKHRLQKCQKGLPINLEGYSFNRKRSQNTQHDDINKKNYNSFTAIQVQKGYTQKQTHQNIHLKHLQKRERNY